MRANSLIELDRDHLIHPVISWKGHEARGATVLQSADGACLTDAEGHTLLDGFSGLWCVNVGYGHDSIVEAAAEQMRRLPYATSYFHFSSEPAIRLAARLAELAPGDLNHVYFTLGGSDAVDSAVRFIRYYYNVTGRPAKKHMIALERGYHGSSTIGAGLTAIPAFHDGFDAPTPLQHHIPSPYPYRNPAGDDDAAVIAASVAALKAKVEELGADTVAAFFAEPVQGSGGVIVPPDGWLKAMRDAARDLDILFVADEVITGFGRTGPLFGCEHDGVVPDLMTTAKGLTSGYSPMGAVLMSDRIYRAIADNAPAGKPIGHGFTYSAHPVSAAVGLEVLRLYTEGGLLENGRRAGERFTAGLKRLADHPLVGDVRVRGLLAGVELVTDKAKRTKPSADLGLSGHLARFGYRNGVIFRAFADDIVGFAPPLCCSESDIDTLLARFEQTLNDVLAVADVRAALA
ncbi:aminotransferase class III-fold pyridoxal phosphate-dependent enzyme [Methylobacterium currus]|uniref:aminotransferase class III-fold pyridoxal phosphate-dependent enzyme n=1 Tax=Methylobacterium currus TaxID=2051553 RepID=UPI001E455390|nr:aminotransferase class III-fold pyridoxal phosphate-dependent enzyme [Methylobacterium currus]UHC15414.1 aminotransferase class III-fold pyridoxal phosphate-dependent enzyme [Methylobacterium currus]